MTETFLIRSRRAARRARIGIAQHLLTALLLVTSAWPHLSGGGEGHRLLPALEMAAALVLVGMVIREKSRRTPHHSSIGWLEIAGAAMLYVEAFAKLQERHHTLFYVISFVPPTVVLLFGIFDSRIRSVVRFEASDDLFVLRSRLLRWRRVPWEGLTGYRFGPKRLELWTREGHVHILPTGDIENLDEARAWAETQFERRGLSAAAAE